MESKPKGVKNLVTDEMLMQFKKMLGNWCDEILKNEEYTKVASSYPYIKVNDILANINNNLDDLKKVADVISLVKKYKENANYLTENETVSKLSHLFSAVDDNTDFGNSIIGKTEKIEEEQKEIISKLEKMRLDMGKLFEGNADATECVETKMETNNEIVSISPGWRHVVGLKSDGTVVATGKNDCGQCDVGLWRDIIAISAGRDHTVGLKKDGTVIATGNNEHGQLNVEEWNDITVISAGNGYSAGLKKNGIVVSSRQFWGVDKWRDITAISAGHIHLVGLEKNGTVVAAGCDDDGQCDVGLWRDITAISAGGHHTIGLKEDGTVITTGKFLKKLNVKEWRDIIAVSAGCNHAVGLKKDGTVVATGKKEKYGHCIVGHWRDITAVFAGFYHTVGLKKDGTIVEMGFTHDIHNVEDWDKAIN